MLSCLSISSSTIKDKDNFSWSDHFTWTTDLNLLAFVCLVLVFFTLCLKHSYVKSICNSRAYPKDVSSRGTRRKSITLSKWCILLSWTVLMCKVFFLVLMLEKTRLITNATPTYFFLIFFYEQFSFFSLVVLFTAVELNWFTNDKCLCDSFKLSILLWKNPQTFWTQNTVYYFCIYKYFLYT